LEQEPYFLTREQIDTIHRDQIEAWGGLHGLRSEDALESERWFSGTEGPQAPFAGRVLSFDEKAGLVWARLMADGAAKGRPRSPLDMIIAASLKRMIAWLSPKTK
jgi:predicted nucleic acid-binding protein